MVKIFEHVFNDVCTRHALSKPDRARLHEAIVHVLADRNDLRQRGLWVDLHALFVRAAPDEERVRSQLGTYFNGLKSEKPEVYPAFKIGQMIEAGPDKVMFKYTRTTVVVFRPRQRGVSGRLNWDDIHVSNTVSVAKTRYHDLHKRALATMNDKRAA